MPPPADEQAAMQQKVMQYMMIFMGLMFFKVASGLCIYFIASSLWGLAERRFLPKTAPLAGASTGASDPKGPSSLGAGVESRAQVKARRVMPLTLPTRRRTKPRGGGGASAASNMFLPHGNALPLHWRGSFSWQILVEDVPSHVSTASLQSQVRPAS